MNITVTVSEFRENLAKYLELLKVKGNTLRLIDGRKKTVVTSIVKADAKSLDWDTYLKEVDSLGGMLLSEDDIKDMKKFRKKLNHRFEKASDR